MKTLASSSALAFVLIVGLASSATAYAQGGDNAAAAEALFREARDLMAAERFEEACPKLEASQKLDGGYGTLYNLGMCYEQVGKTASAWATFRQARDLARQSEQTERVEKAEARSAALEPMLIRLRLEVGAPAPGTEIRRDGAPIDPAAWATPLPVDPGTHRYVATAPGKRAYEIEVTVTQPGLTETIVIPPLEDAVAGGASDPAAPTAPVVGGDSAPRTASGLRTAAFIAGGVGLAGVGVGAAFGLVASSNWNDALDDHCQSESLCSQEGLDLTDDAKTFAGVSTALFIVGGLGLAGGTALFIASMGDESSEVAWTISPAVGPGEGALVVRGSF